MEWSALFAGSLVAHLGNGVAYLVGFIAFLVARAPRGIWILTAVTLVVFAVDVTTVNSSRNEAGLANSTMFSMSVKAIAYGIFGLIGWQLGKLIGREKK